MLKGFLPYTATFKPASAARQTPWRDSCDRSFSDDQSLMRHLCQRDFKRKLSAASLSAIDSIVTPSDRNKSRQLSLAKFAISGSGAAVPLTS